MSERLEKATPRADVAIVGAGFSGLAAALQLEDQRRCLIVAL
jgi:cation diffusion facilitator CzcD-associated flavoprotein CzcO